LNFSAWGIKGAAPRHRHRSPVDKQVLPGPVFQPGVPTACIGPDLGLIRPIGSHSCVRPAVRTKKRAASMLAAHELLRQFAELLFSDLNLDKTS
jgi:hypothetical protein